MSIFDNDQKSMLDVYLYETSSLFEQLDTILMQSEKTNSFSIDDINSIFRIMHTTKSSSSMMGLQKISELMHTTEDLFSAFRDNHSLLDGQLQAVCNLLFAVSDFMHSQLLIMKDDDYTPQDCEELIQSSRQLLQPSQAKEDKREALSEDQNEETEEHMGIYIRLCFEEDSRMENVRAYMIATQLQPITTFLEYYPRVLENNPDAMDYIKQHGFYLHFEAEDPQRVLEQLHRSLFVEKCEIIDRNDYQMEIHPIKKEEPVKNTQTPHIVNESSSVIPVQVNRLDQLQNLTGELMIAESMMTARLKEENQRDLEQMFERTFHKIFLDMERLVMSMRLVPISRIVPKLNRVVRDICHKEGKEVTFVVKGEEIEIDKEIVDNLFDPLMHLIRNAVDHGIESPQERLALQKPMQGEITLSVENSNGEIVVHIEDDGKGLDVEKIKAKAMERGLFTRPVETYTQKEILSMILLPGFSTNKTVNEFSGRGVGLDVVKNMTDRFKGHVGIASLPGQGTRFSLHLPLTLTIVESILFSCGNTIFSAPSHLIVRFFAFNPDSAEVKRENNGYVYVYKDKVLPVISLHEIYQIEDSHCEQTMIYFKSSSEEVCILADNVLGYQHIVDKPLPSLMGLDFMKQTGISGCSLLGDGRICMTLNIEYLMDSQIWKR